MKITIKSTSAKATKPKNKVKVPVRAEKKEDKDLTKLQKEWTKSWSKAIGSNAKLLRSFSEKLEKLKPTKFKTVQDVRNFEKEISTLAAVLRDINYDVQDIATSVDNDLYEIENNS